MAILSLSSKFDSCMNYNSNPKTLTKHMIWWWYEVLCSSWNLHKHIYNFMVVWVKWIVYFECVINFCYESLVYSAILIHVCMTWKSTLDRDMFILLIWKVIHVHIFFEIIYISVGCYVMLFNLQWHSIRHCKCSDNIRYYF